MPSSPQVKTILTWVMIPLVVLSVIALVLLWPDSPERLDSDLGGTFYGGTVTAVLEEVCPEGEQAAGFTRCGEVTVRLEEGPDAGTEVATQLPGGPGAPRVAAGDRVRVHAGFDPADPDVLRYDIADHQRGMPLLWLVLLFAVAIVALGRWRGLASLAGLAACFTLLLTFVLPAIIGGRPPLLVAVVGAATVMFVIMYLVHGVSVRTSVAVLGTLGALVITGALGYLGSVFVHLTGFLGSSEELTLFTLYPGLDLRGVLLAGIIIGSLGVLDDVTVTQAATVAELARADPTRSRLQLYLAGARVGRAHVASVVNTLVLAYAGASLPLLLLVVVSGVGAGDAVTAQPIAQEIVRSVVATVGLVAAVPITTALAAVVCASARGARAGRRPEPSGDRVPDPPAGLSSARHRRPDPPVAPGEALAPHR
jgi:uncharacterized membrane protein